MRIPEDLNEPDLDMKDAKGLRHLLGREGGGLFQRSPPDTSNYEQDKKDYHCGRKGYIINSETFSTCSQHVRFTFIHSQ